MLLQKMKLLEVELLDYKSKVNLKREVGETELKICDTKTYSRITLPKLITLINF